MGQACGQACCANEEPTMHQVNKGRRPRHRRINSIASNDDDSPMIKNQKTAHKGLKQRLQRLEVEDAEGSANKNSQISDRDGSSARKQRTVKLEILDTEGDFQVTHGSSSGQKLDFNESNHFDLSLIEDVKVEEFDSGIKTQISRYQADVKLVLDYVEQLQQEQLKIVASKNVPNFLFEQVDWSQLDDMQQKLIHLCNTESAADLNRIDAKARKLNQRYRRAALKEIRATFDGEIVRIAGLITEDNIANSSSNTPKMDSINNPEDELKAPDAHLTKKGVEKIVQDFHLSLQKALDQLGACSNAEKHVNELVHRANFRFSDLHTWVNESKAEFGKCHDLQSVIQEEVERLLADGPDEEEREELVQSQTALKKCAKKAKSCEQTLQNLIGFSKQTYSSNPQTLMRKKSIENASVLIKKVKSNIIDVRKLRADLEKILADIGSEAFGELKLKEWEQFDADMYEHLGEIKDEVTSLVSSVTAYLKEDKSDSQIEVTKVIGDAKKLREQVDEASKKLSQFRQTTLSLDGIIEAHSEMTILGVQIDDKYRSLRQICLKGLSQFSDDYSLQKVSDLCCKLAQFSFVHFPENLLHDFQKDSYKGELTLAQLQKHAQLEALAASSQTSHKSSHSRNNSQQNAAFDSPNPKNYNLQVPGVNQSQLFSAPAFNTGIIDNNNSVSQISSSGMSSFFEDHKFDFSAASSNSGGGSSNYGSHITVNVSVGLCGLAGKPKISMAESEAWIMDPRTPIKKFAALLFKLANVRQQVFRQLQKEFLDISPISNTDPSGNFTLTTQGAASFVTQNSEQTSSQLLNTSYGSSGINDSFVSLNNESWYSDFVNPIMDRLTNDDSCQMVKLGPINICKTVKCGYKYFFLGEKTRTFDQRELLLLPHFATRYLLTQNSNVKEMLRSLRRESLMIIVNYQFGFKRLDKIN